MTNFNTSVNTPLTVGRDRALAISPIEPRTNLCRLVSAGVACISIATLAIILAGIVDCASVAIVGVDSTNDSTINGDDVVEYKIARATIPAAVATASGDLAVVVDVEVLHRDRSTAVELDDLVVGLECTSSVNVGRAARLLKCAFIG